MNDTDDLLPTRRTLLSRLKDWNDQESWRVFFETYWRLIYSSAIRAGLSDAEAQDVVQETVISVVKKMGTFEYQEAKGSFKGWLLQLTSWRIRDGLRKRKRLEHFAERSDTGTAETSMLERMVDPASLELERNWDKDWEENLLGAAMERVKRKVDPRHYQIFDLNAVKGWPAAKVAALMRVRSATVYMVRHRITNQIKKEVARLREQPVSFPPNQEKEAYA